MGKECVWSCDVQGVVPAAADCGWPERTRAGCHWCLWRWWRWERLTTEEGCLHRLPALSESSEGPGEEVKWKVFYVTFCFFYFIQLSLLLLILLLTHLFSVQCSADSNFPTARVDRELLQKVTAHYRVPQQIIDRAILICGSYLEIKKRKDENSGEEYHLPPLWTWEVTQKILTPQCQITSTKVNPTLWIDFGGCFLSLTAGLSSPSVWIESPV